jgi:hypothetical protein
VRGAKVPTHQATISTLCEVLLQNHASPSRQQTARKPKMGGLTLTLNPLQNHTSSNLQDHG